MDVSLELIRYAEWLTVVFKLRPQNKLLPSIWHSEAWNHEPPICLIVHNQFPNDILPIHSFFSRDFDGKSDILPRPAPSSKCQANEHVAPQQQIICKISEDRLEGGLGLGRVLIHPNLSKAKRSTKLKGGTEEPPDPYEQLVSQSRNQSNSTATFVVHASSMFSR